MRTKILTHAALVAVVSCAPTAGDVAGKDRDWLLANLRVQDPVARAAVVAELGRLGDPSTVADLIKAARDPESRVRAAALGSLNAVGGDLEAAGRREVYVDALGDPDASVRSLAFEGLEAWVAIDPSGGLVDRLVAASRGSEYLRQRAALRLLIPVRADGVDELFADVARTSGNGELRRIAAEGLGKRGGASARGLLQQLRTSDLDEGVRLAAERALAQIGGDVTDLVIAVLPFETQSEAAAVQQLVASLQDLVASELTQAGLAKIVNRAATDEVLAELALQDALSDERVIELGRVLEATQVVYGIVLEPAGGQVTIIVNRVDVQTREQIQSVNVTGGLHDPAAIQRELARRLVTSFRVGEAPE